MLERISRQKHKALSSPVFDTYRRTVEERMCPFNFVDPVGLVSPGSWLSKKDGRNDGGLAGGRVQSGMEHLPCTTSKQDWTVTLSRALGVCLHG